MNDVEADPVGAYLRRLAWALRPVPASDRDSILSEIESHIRERCTSELDNVATVLSGLGPPDALAQAYVEDHELSSAVNRAAPGALFMNVLGRSTRSGAALGGSIVAGLLYLTTFSLVIAAVIKPIVPSRVGLWTRPGGFQFGFSGDPAGKEVLGFWFIPIALAGAMLSYAAGTILLRRCGRWLLRRSRDPSPG